MRNTSGQIVRHLKTGQLKDLSDLESGMYYVTLTYNSSVITRKLIKY
ncbi:MAG: T9SS type A sorting domain-containing protein [Crocinitomicaceae bacterium]